MNRITIYANLIFANRSLSSATADNATQLGGVPASGFIQNTTQIEALETWSAYRTAKPKRADNEA